jgi:integrase
MGVLTGQRRGAFFAMRWEELDFTHATWTIKPAHGNKKADIVVPLVQPALAILERRRKHRTGSAFVFPGRAKSGHLEAPKGAWKALHQGMRALAIAQALTEHKVRFAKDASLTEMDTLARSHKIHVPVIALRIHDLRHTLGSWMASTNASLPVIGKALGHKSHQSTQRYAHLQSDPARVAMTAAVEALAAAGSTKVVKLKRRKAA